MEIMVTVVVMEVIVVDTEVEDMVAAAMVVTMGEVLASRHIMATGVTAVADMVATLEEVLASRHIMATEVPEDTVAMETMVAAVVVTVEAAMGAVVAAMVEVVVVHQAIMGAEVAAMVAAQEDQVTLVAMVHRRLMVGPTVHMSPKSSSTSSNTQPLKAQPDGLRSKRNS
jgi:hypothetical protein